MTLQANRTWGDLQCGAVDSLNELIGDVPAAHEGQTESADEEDFSAVKNTGTEITSSVLRYVENLLYHVLKHVYTIYFTIGLPHKPCGFTMSSSMYVSYNIICCTAPEILRIDQDTLT